MRHPGDLYHIGTLDPRQREEQVREAILHIIRTMNEVVPLIDVVLFTDQEQGADFYRNRLFPMLEKTFEAARHGMTGWSQRPIDPSVVMTSVFGMSFGVSMDRLFRKVDASDEYLANEMATLVIHGLSVPEASAAHPAPRSSSAEAAHPGPPSSPRRRAARNTKAKGRA